MKRKGLLRITLLLAFTLCLAGVIFMSSCGEKVTDIYVASTNSPRLTYVQGQDLDLSGGILTIVLNGQEEKVPLSSEEITISGYDKDTLGIQTLTITYNKLTTSITVTVIPRIVAEGYESSYFVGDEFDKEMGKLKIANDDATIFYVNMKETSVKLVSFNSDNAGTVKATVSYTKGANTYECSFDVTVYEHSNIIFTPPTKTNYLSHEKGLDVTGGYFTVASSDGTLTKNVPLKEDMVKNFDLSEATMANRETPFEKTLTVEYLPGKTFDYKIKIVFSDVSVVNYYATEILSKIKWPSNASGLATALTQAQKDAAINAVNAYYDLSSASKNLIDTSTKEMVARAAAVVAYELFQAKMDTYSDDCFSITENKQFVIKAREFERVSTLITELEDESNELNVYASILYKLIDDFPEVNVIEDKDIQTFVSIYTEESFDGFITILQHMVDLYTTLKEIPDDWTLDDLKLYNYEIEMATDMLIQTNYYNIKSNFYKGSGDFYRDTLSKWRKNDDFFDIIWSYYLYVREDGASFIRTKMFGPVPMPKIVEEWYANLHDAIYLVTFYQQNYSGSAALSDISQFMYYYYATYESITAIKESEDQFAKDIYEAFNGDYSTRSYIHTVPFGYLYHAGALVDSNKYTSFWGNYYSVLKVYLKNELNAETNKEQMVAMFDAFQELTPAELYGFIASLNLMYDSLDRNKMDENGNTENYYMLSYTSEKIYNIFSLLLRDYYSTYLTDNNQALFIKLMRAIENYSFSHVHPVALERFNTLMSEFVTEFDKLSQDDKDNFIKYFGKGYTQYRSIWELSNKSTDAQLTAEEQALLERIKLAIERYGIMLNANLPDSNNYTGVIFALFAEARDAYNDFLAIASDEAKAYLFTKTYNIMEKDFTLDVFFYLLDITGTNALTKTEKQLIGENGNITHVTAWDLFDVYEIDELLVEMYKLLYYSYDSESATLTDEYIISLISRVSSLSKIKHQIFQFLGSSEHYYTVLSSYLNSKLSTNAQEVANSLIQAEKMFANISTEENKTEFKNIMESVSKSYDSLSDSDKVFLDAMYKKYMSEYDKLSANE